MPASNFKISGGRVYARTIGALCSELGISNTTYNNWRAAGCPGRSGAGYPLVEIFRWYRERSANQQQGRSADQGQNQRQGNAELLKLESEAKLKYLKLQETQNQLVRRDEVHQVLVLIGSRLKDRLEAIERKSKECGEILRETLEDLEKDIDDYFGGS